MKSRGFLRLLVTILVTSLSFFQSSYALQCIDLLSGSSPFYRSISEVKRGFKQINSDESARLFVDKLHRSVFEQSSNFDLSYLKKKLIRDLTPYVESFGLKRVNKTLDLLVKIDEFYLNRVFMEKVESAAFHVGEKTNVLHFARLFEAFNRLRVAPSDKFLNDFENVMLEKINRFSPSFLKSIVFSYGSLGIKPSDQFMKEWFEVFERKVSSFNSKQLAGALYGLHLLGNQAYLESFIEAVGSDRFKVFMLDDTSIRVGSIVREYTMTVWGKDYKELQQFEGLFQKVTDKPTAESGLESKASGVVRSWGVKYSREFQTTPGFFVDFFFPTENKILQIDGPLHFTARYVNGERVLRLRVKDELMDQVLRAYGYKIERWNVDEVNRRYGKLNHAQNFEDQSLDHASQSGFINLFNLGGD